MLLPWPSLRQPLRAPTFEELYAQIEALPEGITGEILEPGVLRTMSRPGRAHRRAARNCQHNLSDVDANIGGTGWWIESEAEIHFPGGRLVVPDLIGYRVERVPELPDENPLTILPGWCCEILSPTTARDDIAVKLPLYAKSGVPWIWSIDPALRLLEVWETIDGRPALTVTAKDDDCVELPPSTPRSTSPPCDSRRDVVSTSRYKKRISRLRVAPQIVSPRLVSALDYGRRVGQPPGERRRRRAGLDHGRRVRRARENLDHLARGSAQRHSRPGRAGRRLPVAIFSPSVIPPQGAVSRVGALQLISAEYWNTATRSPCKHSHTYTSVPWVAEPTVYC